MVNAVLSSKDHSGQVAELQYRIVKQTKMIGLVGNIIKAYDDKDAEAADDSAYIHAVDEALDYLRSINSENKRASEPERAADKMLWDMWYAYMSSECRCYQGHMPRTGRRDVLAQAEAEAKKRLLMDYRMLESRIGTRWAGHHVVYFPQTDSTNLQAKAAGEAGSPHGSLFVTDRQSAGRGRRGRAWESPGGENIYMTLLLRPEFPPERASMLTLVMALAAAEGIETVCGGEVGIKWPNDLVLKGKKICGILTEMSAEVDYIHYVVIGVGINVNQETFPEEIRETATSLRLETGKKVIRGELITEILKRFEENYEIFAGTRDLSGLQEAYSRRLVNRDREVKVLDPAGAYEAHALGIDERGELIVRTREGETRKVFAGEVSVRGIYGYV